jgi:thioredoxin reductase (NADPH)
MDFSLSGLDTSKPLPDKVWDTVIIGAGPGGLTAALYAGRYRMDTLVLEKEYINGGQMINTELIENYPGFSEPVMGKDLSELMEKQAKNAGVTIDNIPVDSVDFSGDIKILNTEKGPVKTRTVIISTGASPRELGALGEKEFRGKGVSYCATCDAPFFRDRIVAVVGGGNTALDESHFLSKYAKKLYLIHRRDQFRADKILQEKVLALENVEAIMESQVQSIELGDSENKHLVLETKGKRQELPVDGIFIFIGLLPNNSLFTNILDLDEDGYIVTDKMMGTSIPGVFAIGDVIQKPLRQIATAVGDGSVAAHAAHKFIEQQH